MAKKSYVKADEIQIKGNQIFSPVRRKWLPLTPEERVRQDYLSVLTEGYGYTSAFAPWRMSKMPRASQTIEFERSLPRACWVLNHSRLCRFAGFGGCFATLRAE